MSHFATLVILEPNVSQGKLEDVLSERLAPFDENKEVEEYERDCWCRGRLARKRVDELLAREMGSWEEAKRKFNSKHKLPEGLHSKELSRACQEQDELYRQLVAKPRIKRERELLAIVGGENDPDPNCDECHGSGHYPSQYNQLSKWDWWQIGGRWTGSLDGYDPETDPENIEVCDLCHGTGYRDDKLGREERAKYPDYKCNGCDGKGKRPRWPSEWKSHLGDILPISKIKPDFIPFAILTPDGAWHEHGHMGWWAVVSDEKENWEDEARSILAGYPDYIAVLCDLHI